MLYKHSLCLGKLGALMRYDWPGNVRELDNIIQRMIILSVSDHIDAVVLPLHLTEQKDPRERELDYLPPQSLDDVDVFHPQDPARDARRPRFGC